MATLEETVVGAAREAGELFRLHAFDYGKTEWKGKDNPVTWLDKRGEEIIHQRALAYAPANFIGEELGIQENGADHTWIIDPLDGTKSLLRGELLCAVSIAVEHEGKLAVSAVYDFMREVLYVAPEGAPYIQYRGERKPFIRPSGLSKKVLMVSDVPLPLLECLQRQPGMITKDRNGSIALATAQTAAGTYDGYIHPPTGKGGVWDIAAGYHLMSKSDVTVLDAEGNPFDYRHPQNGIIALRNSLVPSVVPLLKQTLSTYR